MGGDKIMAGNRRGRESGGKAYLCEPRQKDYILFIYNHLVIQEIFYFRIIAKKMPKSK